jgi:hypothetical protein
MKGKGRSCEKGEMKKREKRKRKKREKRKRGNMLDLVASHGITSALIARGAGAAWRGRGPPA